MKKTLNVRETTWERLMKIKLKIKARSLDEVLNYLCDLYEKTE